MTSSKLLVIACLLAAQCIGNAAEPKLASFILHGRDVEVDTVSGRRLRISNYFTDEKEGKWRGSTVEMIREHSTAAEPAEMRFNLPEGEIVKLSRAVKEIPQGIQVEEVWTVEPEGFIGHFQQSLSLATADLIGKSQISTDTGEFPIEAGAESITEVPMMETNSVKINNVDGGQLIIEFEEPVQLQWLTHPPVDGEERVELRWFIGRASPEDSRSDKA